MCTDPLVFQKLAEGVHDCGGGGDTAGGVDVVHKEGGYWRTAANSGSGSTFHKEAPIKARVGGGKGDAEGILAKVKRPTPSHAEANETGPKLLLWGHWREALFLVIKNLISFEDQQQITR